MPADPRDPTHDSVPKAIGGGLLAAGAAAVPLLVPLAFPDMAPVWAQVLLGVCGIVILAGLVLFWTGWRTPRRSPAVTVTRRWTPVGAGQGWIELRVRDDAGGQFVVSANPGDRADQIAFDFTFGGPRGPRRRETIELIVEVDGQSFELDVEDRGGQTFGYHASLWRDVEHLRQIVGAIRRGKALSVAVPEAGLRTTFSVADAYDVLEEVEYLGQIEPGDGSAKAGG